ncbi:hypothetical protein V6N11_072903 [Hibiscus sabdariffa]|uniref:Uncharacterized protein n=1 Tax=Hibiscus sabdariffa TaxID=183260 RepID=A0ABR2P0A9_9ROSI
MEQVGEQHGDKQQVGKQQAGNQQAGEKQQQDGEQRIGVRVQQTGEQVQGRENQSVSVFVENIPKAMHWKAENVEGVDCIKLCDTDAKGDNWAGTGCEGPDGTKEIMGAKKDDQKVEGHDMVSSRALEDVGNIGLNGVNTEKGSWAKALEDKMNIGVAWNRGNYLDSSGNQNQSEEGRDNIFFPELEK